MFEATDELHAVDYEKILIETQKAWLVGISDDFEVWLPKSECKLDNENNIIYIPFWLVSEKGI